MPQEGTITGGVVWEGCSNKGEHREDNAKCQCTQAATQCEDGSKDDGAPPWKKKGTNWGGEAKATDSGSRQKSRRKLHSVIKVVQMSQCSNKM